MRSFRNKDSNICYYHRIFSGLGVVLGGMKPTSPSTRSTPRERLYDELCKLRIRGLVDPRDRLHEFQGLLRIARSASSQDTDLAKVTDVLERAASRLGKVYGQSIPALLGFSDAAWGKKLPARRDLAYECFCAAERALTPSTCPTPIALQTFRTHIEPVMLKNLVTELIHIDNGD